MKYTTFRNLLIGGAFLAAVGGGVALTHQPSLPRQGPAPVDTAAPKEPAVPAATAPVPKTAGDSPAPTPAADQAAAPAKVADVAAPAKAADAAGPPLRPVDQAVLELLRGPGASKRKDPFPDRPYRVEIKRTSSTEARVKLDLDRDGKWDEKWTVTETATGPGVKRHVAPADDESYSEVYDLVHGAWKRR